RNQFDAFASARTDMAARPGTADRRGTSQGRQLHAVRALGLLQRLAEVFQPDRLDQIADRADLEGYDREFFMGDAEDQLGRRVPQTELGSNLLSVSVGYTDIQEDVIGPQLFDQG